MRGGQESSAGVEEDGTILFVYTSAAPSLAGALKRRGFALYLARSRSEAIAWAREASPSTVVIQSALFAREELELITELKEVTPGSRIVLLTTVGSVWTAVEAMRRGAADYLLEPVELNDVLTAIRPPRAVSVAERPWLLTLERMQWEYIHVVLDFCGGNVSEAARRLGLYRQSLQRMLRRYPPR